MAGDLSARPGESPRKNGKFAGVFAKVLAQPDVLVASGDQIGPLTAVATPGHSPGHLCYWHEATGTLFAGDAFQTCGGPAVAGDTRWRFPFVAMGTWDKALAAASARRVADLPIRQLAPAHGWVMTNANEALEGIITRAEQALATKG
ncbi:MAG: MBL fold metallo-hydrolase [Micrococcales bacterium]|nr:MBL fold metallo-hydrolase [Micrococcales bacterium]